MKTVIVDSTAPNTIDLSFSPNKKYQVTSAELDVGSVWSIDENGEITIIQVVNAAHLKSMTINSSIFEIAQRMRAIASWCYLLITGEIAQESMIDGMLMSIQELGIIITNNSSSPGSNYITSEHIARIIERKHESKRIAPQRDFLTTTDGEALLMTLPGIGKKTAVLLKECGSVAFALVALSDPMITTPTITIKDKMAIRKSLELETGFMLGIIPIGEDQ